MWTSQYAPGEVGKSDEGIESEGALIGVRELNGKDISLAEVVLDEIMINSWRFLLSQLYEYG